MVNAQTWLDNNYPSKESQEIYINEQLEGELDLKDYKKLKKVFISHQVDKNTFEIKISSYRHLGRMQKANIIQCVPVQEYLQNKYPTKEKREQEKWLSINNKNLEGELDLSDFQNLEKLDCSHNKLTNLKLSNCNKLKIINCSNNYLTHVTYPTNSKQLTLLNIKNNNFPAQDLTIFNQFRNLEELWIDNSLFFGSLEFLKDLNKLKNLSISDTDLNSGVEHLPESLEKIYYETKTRPTCKLVEIKEHLNLFTSKELRKPWKELGCSWKENLNWINVGLKPSEHNFANFLKNSKNLDVSEVMNSLTKLRKEYTQIRTWLDWNYPQEQRTTIKKLDISQQNLWGDCDLNNFVDLEKLICSDNKLTSLNLSSCGKLTELNCSSNNLSSLEFSNCPHLEKLSCYSNKLTNLNFSKNRKLKEIYCPNNNLINCNFLTILSNPKKLTALNLRNNNISQNLSVFSRFSNLKELYIGNNDKNKINQGIYNRWEGSLESLKDLEKLEELEIDNTDINSGWEYLPDNLEEIYYDAELRPICKLVEAKEELEKELWKDIHEDFIFKNELLRKKWLRWGFNKEQTKEWIEIGVKPNNAEFIIWFLDFKKLDLNWALENEEDFKDLEDRYTSFGTCSECTQPNSEEEWCQFCNAQHFQEEFPNWTSGSHNIDNFIQQCQLEATSPWNVLEWIPYEKFKNIKHIANGGFGKVHKAEWEEGKLLKWDNKIEMWARSGDLYKDYKTVALKTLSNSQNINQEFLQELTLYKRFKSSVTNMVPCYGISRDREGNYIMVMRYMEEGNLRNYLRKNYQELGFYNQPNDGMRRETKTNLLEQIITGLKDIHRKKLVHRDFHSGNIIVNGKGTNIKLHITDLGLSKPANEEAKEGKIYGVLPYVAPEVLRQQPYTQKADIYSFGMIMYEVLTGLPPFGNESHDTNLALKICQGKRPEFPAQVKHPKLLVDLIKKCWDKEPYNRPNAWEISVIMKEWFYDDRHGGWLKSDTEFYHQHKEAEDYNKTLSEEIRYPSYQSWEVLHSKPINTKEITELLKSLPTTGETSSNLTKINEQIKENEEAIEELKKPLDSELIKLINKFIEVQKKSLGEGENTEIVKLKEEMKEKGLSRKKRDEFIRYCENLINLEQQKQQIEEVQIQSQTNIEIPTKK